MAPAASRRERVYRLLLLSYPRQWRRSRRTEEMLGVLLDAADAAGRARPTVGEALNLLGNGMRARALASIEAVDPGIRNRISDLALAFGGGLALTLLVLGEIGRGPHNTYMPWLDYGVFGLPDTEGQAHLPPRFFPFQTIGVLVYLGWALMLLAVLAGRPKLVREIGLVNAALTLLLPVIAALTDHQRPPGTLIAALGLFNIAAILTARRTTTGRPRWLVPLLAAVIACGLITWRLIILRHYDPLAVERSRSCFYWCRSGLSIGELRLDPTDAGRLGGADGITQYCLAPYALAMAAALLRWRRDRTWFAALTTLSLPFLILAARHRYWALFDVHVGILPVDGSSSAGYYTRQPSTPTLMALPAAWIVLTAAVVSLANTASARQRPRTPLDLPLQTATN